jgi:hypothetical protein
MPDLNRLNKRMKRSFQRQVLAQKIVPANRLNQLRNQSPANVIVEEPIRCPHPAQNLFCDE